jgi:hypothetical protein
LTSQGGGSGWDFQQLNCFRRRLILIQMHANTKKILIETESHEIFIIRADGISNIQGFCKSCAGEVEILPLDASVILSGISAREMVRLADDGLIHPIEAASGHLFICGPSLNKRMKTKNLAV